MRFNARSGAVAPARDHRSTCLPTVGPIRWNHVRMPGAATVSRVGRIALAVVAVLMIGFLAVRALSPSFGADVWFGRTGSWQTVAIVAAVVTVLAAWTLRARNAGRASGVPVAIIGGLGVMSLVLGFSSYWPCYDTQHPKLFTALTFTGALVKGTISD